MEAHRTGTRWTYSEFARLPSEGSDRHEIIAGALVVTPAPGLPHQRIATDLTTLLNTFVRANRLGQVFSAPVDVLFGEGDYLEPDIVFVRQDRTGILSDRGIEGPPDLVVEIISAATARSDRGIKLERYRHFGVGQYWIVDPESRSVEVWAFAQGATTPTILGPSERLRWRPGDGATVLDVGVEEALGG